MGEKNFVDSGPIPHLFISSFEVLAAYVLNYLIFFKMMVYDIINQINYYEESTYVIIIMFVTPVLLGIMYILYILYKSQAIRYTQLIVYYSIISLLWILFKGFVALKLTEQYGTEYFFVYYYKYLLGSVLIFCLIYLMHQRIENFIKYLIRLLGKENHKQI